jgi:hypothetical protein
VTNNAFVPSLLAAANTSSAPYAPAQASTWRRRSSHCPRACHPVLSSREAVLTGLLLSLLLILSERGRGQRCSHDIRVGQGREHVVSDATREGEGATRYHTGAKQGAPRRRCGLLTAHCKSQEQVLSVRHDGRPVPVCPSCTSARALAGLQHPQHSGCAGRHVALRGCGPKRRATPFRLQCSARRFQMRECLLQRVCRTRLSDCCSACAGHC